MDVGVDIGGTFTDVVGWNGRHIYATPVAIDASVMEADASRYHGVAGSDPIDWSDPALNTWAAREYLAALDPEPDPNRKTPKAISLSDPCSAWTAKANKRVQFGYGLNYLIDNDNTIIVDVEATPARTYDEIVATKTMIERTNRRFGLEPERLAADRQAENLPNDENGGGSGTGVKPSPLQ